MSKTYRILSQGLELAVEEIGNGTPVIFAHGLGGNRQITRQQWASVSDHYRLIFFDQRGHGDSAPATKSEYYLPNLMGMDMIHIMDALGIDRAIIGGVSMGACTSLYCAAAHPKRALALLQVGPAFNDQIRPAHQQWIKIGDWLEQKGIDQTIKIISRQWRGLGMPKEAIGEMAHIYRSYHPASMAVAHHSIPNWVIPRELFGKLTMPVFILAWSNDPIHDIQIAQEMRASIRHSCLLEIPGVFTPNIGEIFHDHFLAKLELE
jgi:pimeloyl-ACP methyl ester carboxylesterase